MKKKLISAAVAAMVFTSGYMAYSTQGKHTKTNALALVNIEALSNEEDNPCPDYNYVPNHYIETTIQAVSVTCSREGELSVGSEIITGSYQKGNNYSIIVEIKNCDGEAYGSCCDQRSVGASILSH